MTYSQIDAVYIISLLLLLLLLLLFYFLKIDLVLHSQVDDEVDKNR